MDLNDEVFELDGTQIISDPRLLTIDDLLSDAQTELQACDFLGLSKAVQISRERLIEGTKSAKKLEALEHELSRHTVLEGESPLEKLERLVHDHDNMRDQRHDLIERLTAIHANSAPNTVGNSYMSYADHVNVLHAALRDALRLLGVDMPHPIGQPSCPCHAKKTAHLRDRDCVLGPIAKKTSSRRKATGTK